MSEGVSGAGDGEGDSFYETSQGAEDKTGAGRAELWGNCYLQAAPGSVIVGWGMFRAARRREAGGGGRSRCCGPSVRPCCLSTQDLCRPRHQGLLTVLLHGSNSSTQFLFSFISSELISALADKARHCAPLEPTAVKLNYGPSETQGSL